MIHNLILNTKAFFSKQLLLKVLLAFIAFLTPIKPLLIAALVFAFTDFITGVLAARKRALNAGKKNWTDWWQSQKMQKKIFDVTFYIVGMIIAYYFEILFKDLITFPLHRLVAFLILSVEFWSNMENLSTITGLPLNKDTFFDAVNKFRGTPNT